MSVRIGFVGAGWWPGTVHAPAVRDSGDAIIAGVADPDPDRAAAFAKRFHCPAFPDAATMIRRAAPDGVVVATPHAMHAGIAELAIRHGVGALVEKPLALRSRDGWMLRDLASAAGVPLLVSHPYLFHPHARLVRRILEGGRLGELVSVVGSFDSVVRHLITGDVDSGPARDYGGFVPRASTYSDPALAGGGQGQTQLGHLVSLLIGELGSPLLNVSARMSWDSPSMDLAVAVTATTAHGATVALSSAGTLQDFEDRTGWLRYVGTRGWLVHDALHGRVEASVGVLDGIDLETDEPAYPSSAPVLALIDALGGGAAPVSHLADAENGAHTVDVVEACYASALRVTPRP